MDIGLAIVNKHATPADLIASATRAFGNNWFKWEPQTIRDEIGEMGIRDVPQWAWDKLLASKALLFTNEPWDEWGAFLNFAQAFNNRPVNFRVATLSSPAELAWTVKCLSRIRDREFAPDVQTVMASILLNEGIIIPPKGMEFLEDELDRMQERSDTFMSLKASVREAYESYLNSGKIIPATIHDEDIIWIHTIKLVAIQEYIEKMEGNNGNNE